MIEEQIIPQFPPAYVPDNGRTIDWGIGNIIAYPSGCCVHLSYVNGEKLERVCSIEVAPNPVTCLELHQSQRVLAVGDSKGRAFLWDLDNRRFFASAKSQIAGDKCMALAWKDDVLIIMYASKHLCGYKVNSRFSNEYYINFELLWDVILPYQFERFSIDPHFGRFMLFSGKSSIFSIYKLKDPLQEPIAYFETIELSNPDQIQDAQWSLHLPGYVLIVLRGEIMFFHMDSRSLTPIITQKTTSSSFSFIVQFQNDHSRLMTFHKNGAISVFEAEQNFRYKCKHDFQPKHTQGVIVAAVNSNLRDDLIALYYSNTGLALLDLNSLLIKTANPIYPANVTCFDCDGTSYVYGTATGDIIFGDCFDVNVLSRFSVGQCQVKYISFDATHRRIYWQTTEAIGVLDLIQKKNTSYNSRGGSALHCFGSHGGAFIVQRDKRALGVFINDKEHPLLLKADMFDIAVDEIKSNQQHGRFAVLMQNQETKFYTYTTKGIAEETYALKPKNIDSQALALGILGPNFVTGFSNGALLFYNSETTQTKNVSTRFSSIKDLHFQGNNLFGIGDNNTLFEVAENENKIRTCQFPVDKYCLINEEAVLVRMDDNVVRFIRLVDWKPIHYVSKFLPLPSSDDIVRKFILARMENKGLEYLSEDARDIWQVLKGKQSLRLQSLAGIGAPGFYEHLTCELLDKAGINSKEGERVKFLTYIFANRFADAAMIVPQDDPSDPNYILQSAFGGLLIAAENQPSDKLIVHLKTAATSLLAAERFEDAAVLFRIIRMDRAAVDYMLDYGQIEIALRFIRSILDGEDKKTAVFRVGAEKFASGKLTEAVRFFLGSGQYHAVLATLLKLGHVADAYWLMKELQATGKLQPMPQNMIRLVQIEKLNELTAKIETSYTKLIKNLGIKA